MRLREMASCILLTLNVEKLWRSVQTAILNFTKHLSEGIGNSMDHNSDTERRVFTVDEARALALRSVGRAKPAETAALLMPGYREEAFGWIFIVNKDIEFHPTAMEKDSAIVV